MKQVTLSTEQKGFTLIEVLAALGIFAVVVAMMMSSMLQNVRAIHNSSLLGKAAVAAQGVVDDLRFQEVTDLPTSGSDDTRYVEINGATFEVDVSYCEDASRCTSPELRQIVVRVSHNGDQKYVTESIFTDF